MAYISNLAAQVTEKTLTPSKINMVNEAISLLKKTSDNALTYTQLALDSIHLRVYTDASYATNNDRTLQLGYLVLLCDDQNFCHILDYRSRKSRRVVTSIMAGELLAFVDGVYAGFAIQQDLRNIYGRDIRIRMHTYSKRIYDAITKWKRTTDMSKEVDLMAMREA